MYYVLNIPIKYVLYVTLHWKFDSLNSGKIAVTVVQYKLQYYTSPTAIANKQQM
jgi:hypothetical protein